MAIKTLEQQDETIGLLSYEQPFTRELIGQYIVGLVPQDDVSLVFSTQSQVYMNQLVSMSSEHTLYFSCESSTPHTSSLPCPVKLRKCQHCLKDEHFDQCCFTCLIQQRVTARKIHATHQPVQQLQVFSPDAQDPFSFCFSANFNVSWAHLPLQGDLPSDIFARVCAATSPTPTFRDFALFDCGANCFLLNEKRMFHELFPINGSPRATASTVSVTCCGVAVLYLRDSSSPVRVKALYVSTNTYTIVPGHQLAHMGYSLIFSDNAQFMTPPDGSKTKFKVVNNLPFVTLSRAPQLNQQVFITSHMCHERFLHLSWSTLGKMVFPVSHSPCHAYLVKKSQHRKVKYLVPALKDVPTKKGTHMAMDLLITKNAPSYFVAGLKAALIMIEVLNYSLDHLKQQVLNVLVAHRLRPSVCLADRQSAFASQHFRALLADRNCCLKLVPRNRHGEINSKGERSIGILRSMARAALVAGALNSSLWFFAISHATYIKNRCHHHSTNMLRYTAQFGHEPNYVAIRRFGCLCFLCSHQTKDKFSISANSTRQPLRLSHNDLLLNVFHDV